MTVRGLVAELDERIVRDRDGWLIFGKRSVWFAGWHWLARIVAWFVR